MQQPDFDEVGWIRGQIVTVELFFVALAFFAAIGEGLGVWGCSMALLPTSVALVAHLMEYAD